MTEFPTWLSAIVAIFTIASVLGAAGAVYRVSLLRTQIGELRNTNADLRAEITDHDRRETALEAQSAQQQQKIAVLETEQTGCRERIHMLEDLLTKRSDDAEIRQGIAELKRTVDDELRVMLLRIEGEVRALQPPTPGDGATSHA